MTYLLVAVLLLNAVVLAAWLRPQQEEINSVTVQAAKENIALVPETPASEKAAIKKEAQPEQEAVQAAPAPEIAVTEKKTVAAIETASLSMNPSPEEIRALKIKITEEQLLVNPQPLIEEESSQAKEAAVLDMSQLPLSVRHGLPDLTIKGHIYSNDPMSRLVHINGSILHEGETVTTGLKVNEITMSGVVFDYAGQLFSVRAF